MDSGRISWWSAVDQRHEERRRRAAAVMAVAALTSCVAVSVATPTTSMMARMRSSRSWLVEPSVCALMLMRR